MDLFFIFYSRLFGRLQTLKRSCKLGVHSRIEDNKAWVNLAVDLGLGTNYEKFDSQPPKNSQFELILGCGIIYIS